MIKTGLADADRVYADILKPVVTPLKALVEKEKPIELKKDLEIKEEKGGKREETDVLQEARQALRKKDLDTVWGRPIRESGGQLMLGDTAILTHGNQLMVAKKTYVLTPGLLELLLKKHPQMSQITPQDRRLPDDGDQYEYQSDTVLKNMSDSIEYNGKNQTLHKKKGKGMLPYDPPLFLLYKKNRR